MLKRLFPVLLAAVSLVLPLTGQALAAATSTNTVVVGSKSFTENILIGDMMADLLQAKLHLHVINQSNLGGTMVPWNAIRTGQIDMYCEYTGTGLVDILNHPVMHDAKAVYDYVARVFPKKYGIVWLKPLGFNDTYGIAVPVALAKKDHLKTISDLARVAPHLVFGAEPEFFARPDGFPGLTKVYGLHFKATRELNVGLKYEAISRNDVQVIDVFTTDADLLKYHLVVLQDNKHFFPPYYAAPIVREATLKAHPAIARVLDELAGKISDETMQHLNYQVDVLHRSAQKVAHDFLVSLHLL